MNSVNEEILKARIIKLEVALKMAENCIITLRDFNDREDRKRISAAYFNDRPDIHAPAQATKISPSTGHE